MELLIKNMVCPRCIEAVKNTFKEENVEIENIELGKVTTSTSISTSKKVQLGIRLESLGFELLEPGKSALISQIKTLLINLVHHREEFLEVNLSTYLAEKVDQDYSQISRLFSSVAGVTIERFYTLQKIEKVKELIFYDEMNLSEIAHRLHYSSVAHLSAQFKKETGMTPTEFKKSGKASRKSLDQI
jgi:AraC-like DNA-binding protein